MTAAPDLATAVVAFRSWRLAGGRLMSPFIPCRWQDRVMHARVEALAVPDGLGRFGAAPVHRAAVELGVPVVAHDELESLAAGLGGGVPAALRPRSGV